MMGSGSGTPRISSQEPTIFDVMAAITNHVTTLYCASDHRRSSSSPSTHVLTRKKTCARIFHYTSSDGRVHSTSPSLRSCFTSADYDTTQWLLQPLSPCLHHLTISTILQSSTSNSISRRSASRCIGIQTYPDKQRRQAPV